MGFGRRGNPLCAAANKSGAEIYNKWFDRSHFA
jgi:hypothetical protein